MSALWSIARYEVRSEVRRISTWVYFGLLFALAFIMMCALAGVWPDFDFGSRVQLANSPSNVANLIVVLSIFAVPITSALAGRTVHRDFETRIHPLFFTTPVGKTAYLGGRYLGTVLVNLLVYAALPLGMMVAAAMPFADPERIGRFRMEAYATPFAVIVIPNVLVTAALFLVLAALTRRVLANQVGGVALLLAWTVSRLFTTAIDADWFSHLSDPFGAAPLNWATRYWTVAEQNTLAMPLADALLLNRALWLAIGFGILAYGISEFRFAQFAREDAGRRMDAAGEVAPSLAARLTLPRPRLSFGARARSGQLRSMTRDGTRRILRGVWFWILAALCVAFMLIFASDLGSIYGTETFPVTYQVLEMLQGSFGLFLVIIITIYAGELVWEERETGAAQIHDALPVPTWIPFVAKTLALFAMCAVLLAVAMLTGMLVQAAKGYFHFEPGLYVTELFGMMLPKLALLVVLAMAIQSLVNHKYVGHLLAILFYVGAPLLHGALLPHNLFFYASTPETFYSDMNGYGHTARPWGWYMLFWSGAALVLAVLSNLFWVRGMETGGRWRARLARARFRRPALAASILAIALILGTGGFILHNTMRLNEWRSDDEEERITVEYEKQYKRFQTLPLPRITAVSLDVDIYPERRDLRIRGVYTLVNRTPRPIDQIHVDLLNTLLIRRMELGVPARRTIADREKGYYAFRLARPLAPGDSTTLRFEVMHDARGFEDEPSFFPVVENGTFFNSMYLPGIGYNPEGELDDERARDRHGLPPRPRVPPIDDPRGRARNFGSRDADWIRFAATVSTSADQTAIAPGRLERQWRQGGRRYYRYVMDVPMLNFYSFLSARYAVKRDRWNEVEIEVFHHPEHTYNVDRMIRAVKASLDYYTQWFGPYQHSQVRIVEFPRYGEFAQSFAGTIPYSEGIGFIADVRADDIDYPYFVTAHEVAHQWWGHQLVPADVQGGAMLSETLAEYGALMVMEKEYGRGQIGRFLRHELDAYLQGRTMERRAEMPLSLVEYQQYIHYNKGALAMYALRDYVGEERVNGALRAFLNEARGMRGRYPTSEDLLRHLRAATPDSLRGVIKDLFETVTLWDLRAVRAEGTELGDGRYQVDVTVTGRKVRAGPLGDETSVAMNDLVEIGVFGADKEEPIALRKFRYDGRQRTFRLIVDQWPRRAGIDPLHKLIDRELDDNVTGITRRPGTARPRPADTARDGARRAAAREVAR
ncbi:MAG TPA: M1 family aminopeptidase [Longimicrobium sp.]|nr:M1 family aminopeptidase [Longimicrobium sp.]